MLFHKRYFADIGRILEKGKESILKVVDPNILSQESIRVIMKNIMVSFDN